MDIPLRDLLKPRLQSSVSDLVRGLHKKLSPRKDPPGGRHELAVGIEHQGGDLPVLFQHHSM